MGIEFAADGGVTVNVPSVAELWQMFSWYHIFVVTGIYGFVTHMKSLPAIHRFNRELSASKRADGYELSTMKLFLILLFRSTFILPARLVGFAAGIAWIAVSFVSTGIPHVRSEVMKVAWRWHLTPEKLSGDWKTNQTNQAF